MTAADLFLLLFVGIIALGLICVIGPFMTKGRLSRQLRTLLAPFSTAVTIVAQLKVVRYDIPSSSVAAQIIESWFPHNETELLEGAPAPVYGRFSRSLNYNSGTGSVALELFYSLNYLNSNFLLSRRVGTLTCHLHDYAKVKQTEIRYEWDGNELAVSDLFSPEYKVLHYVLERICSEFICRSYKEITQAEDLSKSPHGRYGKPARQVKPWWRTYSAGEHGQ